VSESGARQKQSNQGVRQVIQSVRLARCGESSNK
jgi:CDGSH-type Zn-finger protein